MSPLRIAVSGPLVLVANHRAAPQLAAGELVRVMADWTPPG